MKWFGQPWPDSTYRAPVCDNDDDWVATPVGEKCVFCPEDILPDNRGVMIPDGFTGEVHPAHIICLLANTIGPKTAAELARTFT